ncbi:cytoskeleton protein RodZ [Vibrio rotiferianus]|uniref:cytoskeleton protein RodZ n=1 Tax=Vibrio rotiferianus TaxID=190895 RepID=UPI0002374EF4|nr:cytoskeleton protein RodZ [Vibrio rotiferianus]
MTEHEKNNETPLSIEAGTLLKNKRESLGMTQKQIADRLRLRVSVIEDIENNQFDSHQVATFIRGYLRSYAKLVSVDEHLVLSALDTTGEAQHQEQEMQSFSRKTKTEKHNSRIMLLTWAIAIVITGISAVWWWQNQQENSLAQVVNEAAVETEIVDDSAFDTEPTVSMETIAVEATADEAPIVDDAPVMVSEVSTETSPVDAVNEEETSSTEELAQPVTKPTVVEVEEKPAVIPAGMTPVTMTFTSDCWIQVKDANGKTLVSGTHKPGQNVELAGKAPFKVILGAPEAVTMTFASEPVDLSGYTSGKVARFTLPL